MKRYELNRKILFEDLEDYCVYKRETYVVAFIELGLLNKITTRMPCPIFSNSHGRLCRCTLDRL